MPTKGKEDICVFASDLVQIHWFSLFNCILFSSFLTFPCDPDHILYPPLYPYCLAIVPHSIQYMVVDWLIDCTFLLFWELKRRLLVVVPQWPLLMKPESAVRETPERSQTEVEMWAISSLRRKCYQRWTSLRQKGRRQCALQPSPAFFLTACLILSLRGHVPEARA